MGEPVQTVEQLVAVREARGLGAEDVVRQLKLAPRQLQAIERGDWEALPGAAFTRAVLRSYGRLLGVDVEPLVSSLSPAARESELRPAATLDEPLPTRSMFGFGSGGGGSRLAWVTLAVLGVIALALFFGGRTDLSGVRSWLSELRGGGQGDAARGSDAAAPAPAATEKLPLALTDSSPAPAAAGGRDAEAPKATQPGRDASGGAGAATVAAPAAAAGASAAAAGAAGAGAAGVGEGGAAGPDNAAGTGATTLSQAKAARAATAAPAGAAAPAGPAAKATRRVVLRFERESWVEARSADGTVVFTGTNPAQTSREFTAAAPVSLVIGNAGYVRAEIDGRSFELAPHIRASVARVTIP